MLKLTAGTRLKERKTSVSTANGTARIASRGATHWPSVARSASERPGAVTMMSESGTGARVRATLRVTAASLATMAVSGW